MSFEKIIGNETVKNNLNKQISNNEVVNSYMFVGQNGIGKKLFAKEFAKMILCFSKDGCDNCESCIKYNSANHPDLSIIEAEEKVIKISQIREMQEDVYKKPILSEKKVFIIDNADYMTEEAQNCLLKTLEDPPLYVVIILVLSNENMLLNTIKSRCLKISFRNLTNEEVEKYLEDNKIELNNNQLILNLINGSIGKIHTIIEDIDIYNKTEQFVDEIITNNSNKSFADYTKSGEFLYKEKEKINNVLEYMMIIIYSKIKQEVDSNNTASHKYISIIENIEKALIKLKSNANYDMCIDELLLKISNMNI